MRKAAVLIAIMAASACGNQTIPITGGDDTHAGGGSNPTPISNDGGDTILPDGGTSSCNDTDGTRATSTLVMSQLVFGTSPFVEFYNNGGSQVDLTNYSLQGSATYLSSAPLTAGERVENADQIDSTSGELALFNSGGTMIHYVCWGQLGVTTLQNQASGVWFSGNDCVPSPSTGQSLHLVGAGTASSDWTAEDETVLGCPVGDH